MRKTRNQFEDWANQQLKKYQKVLLLSDYTLEPIKPSNKDCSECIFRYPYKHIEVRYSEEVFADWQKNDKDGATQVLIHELCHAVTDPFYAKSTSRFICRDDLEDERERLTDHIANIIIKST